MDVLSKEQSSKVLELVNRLYDENSREEALESLARLQCDLDLLSSCVYYSFGIVSILQQEILSIYPYLAEDSIPERIQKRVCNALLILRSLMAAKNPKMSVLDLYVLYFLSPILESPKEVFCNLRKVSLGVLISVVTCSNYQSFLPELIENNLISSCVNNVVNISLTEKISVFYLLNSLFENPQCIEIYFTKPRAAAFVKSVSFMIQMATLPVDPKLSEILGRVFDILCNKGFVEIINIIEAEVPADKWRAFFQ